MIREASFPSIMGIWMSMKIIRYARSGHPHSLLKPSSNILTAISPLSQCSCSTFQYSLRSRPNATTLNGVSSTVKILTLQSHLKPSLDYDWFDRCEDRFNSTYKSPPGPFSSSIFESDI